VLRESGGLNCQNVSGQSYTMLQSTKIMIDERSTIPFLLIQHGRAKMFLCQNLRYKSLS
jgi:hypothetical protein